MDSSDWPWPPELDGPIAAPDQHRVLFENDRVRVLETTIRVGEITPLHTHRSPTVMYVVSGSHFVRRDETGATMVDSRAAKPVPRLRRWLRAVVVGKGLIRLRVACKRPLEHNFVFAEGHVVLLGDCLIS